MAPAKREQGPFTREFSGYSKYSDAYPGLQEPLPRIYVKFKPEGANVWFLGLLDTGGHYCVLSPEVAEAIDDKLVQGVGRKDLLTARGLVRGELFRHRIDLVAEGGRDLSIEATILVSPDWRVPYSILGYTGILDRVRFSVDPEVNRIYFDVLAGFRETRRKTP